MNSIEFPLIEPTRPELVYSETFLSNPEGTPSLRFVEDEVPKSDRYQKRGLTTDTYCSKSVTDTSRSDDRTNTRKERPTDETSEV